MQRTQLRVDDRSCHTTPVGETRTDAVRCAPERVQFTKIEEADRLLNDLDRYPHAFVIACVIDRQIRAERAWLIPHAVAERLGGFSMNILAKLS
jgi:hypothetical protein